METDPGDRVAGGKADLGNEDRARSGWSVVLVPGEASSVGWAVGVEGHAHLVDGDVVVVPAEGDEVVGIMGAVIAAFDDVVGLDSVAAAASFD